MSDVPASASEIEDRTDLERLDDLVEHFNGDHQRARRMVRRIGLDVAEELAAGNPVYVASEDPYLYYTDYSDDAWETHTQFGSDDFGVFEERSGMRTLREIAKTWKEVAKRWEKLVEDKDGLPVLQQLEEEIKQLEEETKQSTNVYREEAKLYTRQTWMLLGSLGAVVIALLIALLRA